MNRVPRQKQKIFYLIGIFVIVILSLGTYFNSLNNHFTNWDDPGLILKNQKIRSLDWQNIKEIFTLKKSTTFQPIRVLSYAIDYHFWGLNPLGYHITNILFYVLTCIMIFFTIKHISRNLREKASPESHERIALIGSLLFAVHPVHVEPVTWLAARKEVLQGFFFFLAFYLYLKGRGEEYKNRIIYFGLVFLSFLFATLSKPSAIVFPAVLLIYEFSLMKKGWVDFIKRHWLFFALSLLVSLIFTTILINVMIDAGGIKPYRGGSFLNNILNSFYAFLYNIKLLILTVNFSAAYTVPIPNPILSIRTFFFIGIVFLFFGLSIWSLKKSRVFFFSFFFFFVTLLPYLNIIPISTLLADRYVFIASFSYCFLLGIGFNKLYEFRNKRFSEGFFKVLSITVFLLILFGYSFMTIHQNSIWENSYTLWSDSVEKHPESNTANALLGVVYMDLGMNEMAVKYLEKAIQILPYDYQSINNLGIVYSRLGQHEKALKEMITAIYLSPEDDLIQINLASIYQRAKEYKKAEAVLKYLILKNEKNANLHYRLGLLYKEMGDLNSAISELQKSQALAPRIINPYEELGNIYASKRDTGKAKYYYLKGIESVPEAKFKVGDLRWMIQDLECHR